MNLLRAMARQEGEEVAGSRPQRNNDPGDIDYGPFAKAHGADRMEAIPAGVKETPRFAHFPTEAAGFAAMKALLQGPEYKGKTVRQMLLKYAPPSDGNNVSAYEANVCKWTPCQPADIIDGLL